MSHIDDIYKDAGDEPIFQVVGRKSTKNMTFSEGRCRNRAELEPECEEI